MQRNILQDDVNRMLASIYNGDGTEEDTPPRDTELPQVTNEYDVYVESDRITFIKKEPPAGEATSPVPQGTIVSAPGKTAAEQPLLDHRTSTPLAYATIIFSLFLILCSLMAQLQIALNPPTAIITIIPQSRTLTLSGTVQLGRLLNPITVSQQATAKTTGHGHQPARVAHGSITFYNGQLTQQFIPAGTILTGTDGSQIETLDGATIPALDPAATPPTLGVVTIAARAVHTGAGGNIQAYDINQPFDSVIAKNTEAFTGGQDARDFPVVTKGDIGTAAKPLKTTLMQSMPGVLQAQLGNGESLHMLPCSPTTTADHQAGEEATQVTVIVSFTCSGIAYNGNVLRAKVTQLLNAKALKKFGTGYTLQGNVQVSVQHTTITPAVFLSFSSSGTWVYALTEQVQQHIKALVTGKRKTIVLQLLSSLPGIERVSLAGGDDSTPLPKETSHIHIVVIYRSR